MVAVVTSCGEKQSFNSKAGKELTKAEVELVDDSNTSIKLTIWGNKIDDVLPKVLCFAFFRSCPYSHFGANSTFADS